MIIYTIWYIYIINVDKSQYIYIYIYILIPYTVYTMYGVQ